jgi:hypothetical protein
MAFQKAIFISFGLSSVLALGACASDKGTGGNGGMVGTSGAGGTGTGGTPAVGGGGVATATGGASGAAGAAVKDCTQINYADYMMPGLPVISLKNDLLPMFGLSCVVSDCHNAAETMPRAGLNLGYKCAYDVAAKWKCTFPTAPTDNKGMDPQPVDDATTAKVYASLLGMSPTVTGPAPVARVKPTDPQHSFLMQKLANSQTMQGYTCMNQDASHESMPPDCGVSMPQNQALFCEGSSRPKFDAIATWIAQGALNN